MATPEIASVFATPTPASTPAITRVPATITVGGVLLLAPNAARFGGAITNESTATLYLGFTTTPSGILYTVPMVGGTLAGGYSYFELPERYTGPVYGLWSALNGAAQVTEWTA